jgi:hypothetical protein
MLVAFNWHSTCISGFVYTRFALWVFLMAFWLAVICPLSMDYAMAFVSCLLKESGFSSTLTLSGILFHFSTALAVKNKTPFQ